MTDPVCPRPDHAPGIWGSVRADHPGAVEEYVKAPYCRLPALVPSVRDLLAGKGPSPKQGRML